MLLAFVNRFLLPLLEQISPHMQPACLQKARRNNKLCSLWSLNGRKRRSKDTRKHVTYQGFHLCKYLEKIQARWEGQMCNTAQTETSNHSWGSFQYANGSGWSQSQIWREDFSEVGLWASVCCCCHPEGFQRETLQTWQHFVRQQWALPAVWP